MLMHEKTNCVEQLLKCNTAGMWDKCPSEMYYTMCALGKIQNYCNLACEISFILSCKHAVTVILNGSRIASDRDLVRTFFLKLLQ